MLRRNIQLTAHAPATSRNRLLLAPLLHRRHQQHPSPIRCSAWAVYAAQQYQLVHIVMPDPIACNSCGVGLQQPSMQMWHKMPFQVACATVTVCCVHFTAWQVHVYVTVATQWHDLFAKFRYQLHSCTLHCYSPALSCLNVLLLCPPSAFALASL
jgi:hypothetical protein